MGSDFKRIAVVNRGEPAVRFIRAVQDWNRERDDSLRVIALYTEPDRHALFVREADEAYALGSPTFVDPKDDRRKNRYLDYRMLEKALTEVRAEAVWVGWGFVAEHAAFAELCGRLGVVFIGPSPEVMRRLGDKIGSKRIAEEAGVPVAPWSGGAVETREDARRQAKSLGFPLMVKATAGGGGRGIRRVNSLANVEDAFESARSEALAAFGDATVFMERLLEGSRHIEVQIVSDGETVWALGVRDCTIQRRNQKVVEESPSPALTPAEHREVCDAAARLGKAAGYRNAGTVEFLFDPAKREFFFMEVNTRLQVEHPVTEATTGADVVKLQLHVARGGRLEGAPPAPRGHAIEVRVNAEDPEHDFAPAPGRISLLRLPGGPGVRVDSGFVEGDHVAPEFDSMLAKVIAHGADRNEALARLKRALLEMRLAIEGGANNKGFLISLLDRPEVRSGEVDVGWLDRLASRKEHLEWRHGDRAIVQAAIDAYEERLALEQAQFLATAARGRFALRNEPGPSVRLRHRGLEYEVRVLHVGPQEYRAEIDGVRIEARVERVGALERRVTIKGMQFDVLTLAHDLVRHVEVEGFAHHVSRDDAGLVRSPAPAVVLSIAVEAGEEVAAGDRLAVLEIMKTEMTVPAPVAGKVRQVFVAPNVQVGAGQPLILFEPLEREVAQKNTERVRFDALDSGKERLEDPAESLRRNLESLRRLALGYDVDAGAAKRLIDERHALCARVAPDDPDLLRGEDEILEVFADICSLFAHRATEDVEEAEGEARIPEEYFLLYLRSLDVAAAGVSPGFIERLRDTVSHYGIESLDRSPALEEALFRIAKAHQRINDQVEIVMDVLERRIEHGRALVPQVGEAFHLLLDRIVAVTRGRFQGLSDLAREARYRLFDRSFFEKIRNDVYAASRENLDALARSPGAADREERVRALIECPQPLAPLITARLVESGGGPAGPMLEVITRRYYRVRKLDRSDIHELDGVTFYSCEFEREGKRLHVASTCARWDALEAAARAARKLVDGLGGDAEIFVDFYVWREGPQGKPEETERETRAMLEGVAFPERVARIVVEVSSPGGGWGMGSLQHYTYVHGEDGLREDLQYRRLHPTMADRLQLWRLSNFEIHRVPSVEDVYLFHGKALENKDDERLFAFAEVRDLTPVRDESGRIARLPNLEMMYMEALAAIRTFQSRRSARERLHWNRVMLYIWPPLELSVEELNEIGHRLAPAVEGLGLQKTVVRAKLRDAVTGAHRDTVIQFANPGGRGLELSFLEPSGEPIRPLSEYQQKVVKMRQRGLFYPYELIELLVPSRRSARSALPHGEFTEHDLDEANRLVPVKRAPGGNTANLVVGVIRNFTRKHPEGMVRVIIVGDPSREMGSVSEPECRRINAAIDLAERMSVPVDWFAVSAGAKISMETGTETMDWCAAVIRRLVEFTQAGGEVNIVVNGVNVGAQSYWNAEATMLMHTRGILIMTSEGSMVLTGKRSLDYSGGVSAEDNLGIGGYERIMGPNAQGQFWALDIGEACQLLMRYYEHSYVAPGERFPRRAFTKDAADRDVTTFPYRSDDDSAFELVGDVFSDEKNPGRHKPFDIRAVMRAVVDQDHQPLERFTDMREAETAVVWDSHVGGVPVCLVGIESRPIPRLGFVPADGPEQWTGGTLFPLSSKKVARAVNAASGNRPFVLLANLSGFDGSPESMRRLQLEYGAEIGRAVVNFKGPLIICVISRYHGGAYVVFSALLNENLEVAALEGSYASVIGGAPAAAVVFSREVDRRARADQRLHELESEIAGADEPRRGRLRARWHELYKAIYSEKLGEVADEFDQVHTVQRAQRVGSLHHVVPPERLRPYLIEALERGMKRELARLGEKPGEGP